MNIICEICWCLIFAIQNSGSCHSCKTLTQQEAITAVGKLDSELEMAVISCYEKGKKSPIDWKAKVGPVIPH